MVLVGLAGALVYWRHAFQNLEATGPGDWRYFFHMWEAGRVALERHGEVLLWNPYQCAGVTMWGNPQAQIFSPFFLLTFAVGTTLAIKLHILLHSVIALTGTYVLARRHYGMAIPGAMVAAAAWAFAGNVAFDGSGGHSTFLSFAFTPWIILALRRSIEDPRWAAGLAALLVLLLLEGGTYSFPYCLLIVAFDSAVQLTDRRRRWGLIRSLLIAAALVALLAPFRVIPALRTLEEFPRQLNPGGDIVDYQLMIEMFTAREHERYFGHEFVWDEYMSYVGWLVLVLAAAGIVIARRRGRRHLVLGLLVFLALMHGNNSELSLWTLLQHLPVYDSLRVPARFSLFVVFFLALLAGLAVDRLTHLLETPRARTWLEPTRRAIPYAILAIIVVDISVVVKPILERWTYPPLTRDAPTPRFYLHPQPDFREVMIHNPQRNQGTPGCHEAIDLRHAAGLWLGDSPQVRVERGRGAVLTSSRTPNTISAEVMLQTPARLIFNQNTSRGWTANAGAVQADRGRLALDLPPGRHQIVARYAPDELRDTTLLFLGGIAASVLVALFATRRRFAWLASPFRSWRRGARG